MSSRFHGTCVSGRFGNCDGPVMDLSDQITGPSQLRRTCGGPGAAARCVVDIQRLSSTHNNARRPRPTTCDGQPVQLRKVKRRTLGHSCRLMPCGYHQLAVVVLEGCLGTCCGGVVAGTMSDDTSSGQMPSQISPWLMMKVIAAPTCTSIKEWPRAAGNRYHHTNLRMVN